ncbi:MAG: hypothetical protein EZS28_028032 [Streblomastix strix]|uniref:Uncharacterized protein n=1 Tax=Streblomastix strix TaxID=222440 RepID=A0A5J4V240_9EUKA|nr:MAG: hypothetical protein EZS28_028032 [Streblomastix strix]
MNKQYYSHRKYMKFNVHFNPLGNKVVSGWIDGKIRSFGLDQGRLLYEVQNAHKQIASMITFYYSGVTLRGGLKGKL